MAPYVRLQQFKNHFAQFLPRSYLIKGNERVIPKIGVMVSGGPDSMALAFMLKQLSSTANDDRTKFDIHAFIVDHGAREGSRQEALEVSAILKRLKISSSVSTISWPKDKAQPSTMTDFEQQARHRRYELIATEAVNRGIDIICTGHHEDDVVEGLIIRMCRNLTRNVLSFLSMAPVSPMPCCETVPRGRSYSRIGPATMANVDRSEPSKQRQEFPVITNGIRLVRPLLNYNKAKLIRTCKHFDVPFVVDKTNHDPTFTNRNAVRALRTTHTLPKALQTKRMTQLSRSSSQFLLKIAREAHRQFSNLEHFSIQSEMGLAKMQFKFLSRTPSEHQIRGFSYFMARMGELVGAMPADRYPRLLLRDETVSIWTAIADLQRRDLSDKDEVVELPLTSTKSRMLIHLAANTAFSATIYLLRDGIRRTDVKRLNMNLERKFDDRTNFIPLLWDNRFWIYVKAPESLDGIFKIVPASKAILDGLLKKLIEQGHKAAPFMASQLSHRTIHRAIETLPILTYNDEVILLPTLHIRPEPASSILSEVSASVEVPRSDRLAALLESRLGEQINDKGRTDVGYSVQ